MTVDWALAAVRSSPLVISSVLPIFADVKK